MQMCTMKNINVWAFCMSLMSTSHPSLPYKLSWWLKSNPVLLSDCFTVPVCVVALRGDLFSRTKSSHYTGTGTLLSKNGMEKT